MVRKHLSALLLFLALTAPALPAPMPITEVLRATQVSEQTKHFYVRHPGVEVLVEFGIASWYDCPTKPEKVQNQDYKVADHIYPVAHKTLPFGTLIKVINPANNRKILARVIDRGPFIAGRIIDLDAHSAKALGINGIGKIVLKIFKVNPNEVAMAKGSAQKTAIR